MICVNLNSQKASDDSGNDKKRHRLNYKDYTQESKNFRGFSLIVIGRKCWERSPHRLPDSDDPIVFRS